MIKVLNKLLKVLPELILEKANAGEVHTMYIDYHKPYVYRIWFQWNEYRVFLHKIMPCDDSLEALYHPHKWDSAIKITKGSYEMGIGHSDTNEIPKTDCKLILSKGTKYEMTEPNGWHYVNPIGKPCYSVMITGKLNGRQMPIESPKEFREMTIPEIRDVIFSIPELKGINRWVLLMNIHTKGNYYK